MKLRHRRQFLHLAAGAVVLPAVSPIARAQAYPARPVRIIVPFAPGGPTDVFARLIAQKLSEHLGKQFYVENVAGANGNIGTGQAAKAPHDGYTVLTTVNAFAINPTFFARVPYDPFRDFDPVTLATDITLGIWVHPSLPAMTLKGLVDLIRANPGKYNYASAGTGSSVHLIGEQFRLSLGLDLVHVPFPGGGPATASVVAGHTPIAITAVAPALQHINEGKLRALAVTKHSQSLPLVPSIAEAGYPEVKGGDWLGVLVPAGTPKEIIVALNQAIATAITQPDMKRRLMDLGLEPVASTPNDFGTQIKVEVELWGKLIRAANIKAE